MARQRLRCWPTLKSTILKQGPLFQLNDILFRLYEILFRLHGASLLVIIFVRNNISFVRNIISFVRNIISFVRIIISFVRNNLYEMTWVCHSLSGCGPGSVSDLDTH